MFSIGLSAQTTQLKWLLDLDANAVPTGTPDEAFFHYLQQGHLYRMSVTGEVQEVPYEEVSYLGGHYWQVQRGGLKGVWNSALGEIIPPVYNSIAMATTKTDRCWAFSVGKYGMSAMVNEKNQLIKPWITAGYSNLQMINDTILEYKKAYELEFMSQKGNMLKESQVRWMKTPEFKRLSADKYIYTYAKAGKLKVDTFSNTEPFSAGLAAVAVKNQWGYIAENGAWIIRPQFQLSGSFNENGFAVIKMNGLYGLIKRDGRPVFTPKFVFLKHFAQGLYEFKEGDQIGLCDTTGKTVLPAGQYASFVTAGNQAFAALSPNKSLKIFNLQGGTVALDSIIECKGDLSSELFIATGKNKQKTRVSGLADAKGEWVVPAVFTGLMQQYPYYFIATGSVTQPDLLPGVVVDKALNFQQFLYNQQGKPVLSYSVNSFRNLKESPVGVFELNKLFGLVTPEGLLLEPIYNNIRPMGNNWFYVQKDGQYGVVKAL